MLVIKARGSSQVKALEKLAEEIAAEEVQVLPRRRSGPGVSTLPGATIAPATQAAIMELVPTIDSFGGEYDND
jgi:hypothetical protein